ncbi:hypothetical protein [Vibrio harveyi]|uniref:hypothetical protein n=1 Tax=Vibrio harveyi TaxID=669 RepID=UPI0002F0DAB1|nr:hypothetical protein [Vibrio harveyi]HDM8056223.1 hypothetical protein [Vibrio harveyi]HDM8062145.1 hypothetical protein [Vibrio harveyi]HDM8195215.1 hypothetical protein [Vibrio harveyi]
MTHTDSIKHMYNALVHHYQFDIESLKENELSDRARFFMVERAREAMTNQLHSLSLMAESIGEKDIAGEILSNAAILGSDGVIPMPM